MHRMFAAHEPIQSDAHPVGAREDGELNPEGIRCVGHFSVGVDDLQALQPFFQCV